MLRIQIDAKKGTGGLELQVQAAWIQPDGTVAPCEDGHSVLAALEATRQIVLSNAPFDAPKIAKVILAPNGRLPRIPN